MSGNPEAIRHTFDFGAPSMERRAYPLDMLHALTGTDDSHLLNIALEVARSVPETMLHRIFSASTERFQPVHSLLALTTYHYALGFYSSEEIASRLSKGMPPNWPCSERPDRNLIRRFRNRNRLCVQQALERCLFQFCETAAPMSPSTVPHFNRLIKAEARFRLHQAELADLETAS